MKTEKKEYSCLEERKWSPVETRSVKQKDKKENEKEQEVVGEGE